MLLGGLFTNPSKYGTPRSLAARENHSSFDCFVQSYFPIPASNESTDRHGLRIFGFAPPPMLNRHSDSPIPFSVSNSRSAILFLLASDHTPIFCIVQQSDAPKLSIS